MNIYKLNKRAKRKSLIRQFKIWTSAYDGKLPNQNLSKVTSELSINVFFTIGQLQKKIPMKYETWNITNYQCVPRQRKSLGACLVAVLFLKTEKENEDEIETETETEGMSMGMFSKIHFTFIMHQLNLMFQNNQRKNFTNWKQSKKLKCFGVGPLSFFPPNRHRNM